MSSPAPLVVLLLMSSLAAAVVVEAFQVCNHAAAPKIRHRQLQQQSPLLQRKVYSSDESTNYNYIGFNTNKDEPYVPSGMNPEQYRKIKQDEAAKLAKMNFGAWGPRFQQTKAPDGDWMIQTNLWVRGFQAGQGGANTATAVASPAAESLEQQQDTTRRQRLVATTRTALTSFLLAYLVLDILLLFVSSIRSTGTTKKLISSLVMRQGILQAMRQHIVYSFFLIGKLQFLKTALASLAVPMVSKYRENSYRKLWSKRKTFGLPILAASMGAVALNMAIQGMRALR